MNKYILFLALSLGLAPQHTECFSFTNLKTSISNKLSSVTPYLPTLTVLGAGIAGYYVGKNSNNTEYIEQMCTSINNYSIGQEYAWYRQEFGMTSEKAALVAQAHYDHIHAGPAYMHGFAAALSATCAGISGLFDNATKKPFSGKTALKSIVTVTLAATAFGVAYASGVSKNLDQALHA